MSIVVLLSETYICITLSFTLTIFSIGRGKYHQTDSYWTFHAGTRKYIAPRKNASVPTDDWTPDSECEITIQILQSSKCVRAHLVHLVPVLFYIFINKFATHSLGNRLPNARTSQLLTNILTYYLNKTVIWTTFSVKQAA